MFRGPWGCRWPAWRYQAGGVDIQMPDDDPLAGLEGAAATLATAMATPGEELRMLAETGLHDLARFEHLDSGVGGPQVLTWPHPDGDDDSDWADDWGPLRLDNAALLDETTFYVARRLIRGELPLTPMTVMDLSTYVSAFVLREHVVRNKFTGTAPAGGATEPRTAVDGVITEASTGSDNALWNARLWEHRLRSGDPTEAPLADALLDGWHVLLG